MLAILILPRRLSACSSLKKVIAFIDVLGFKEHVRAAENGSGMSLSELLELVRKLGAPEDRDRFVKHGPTTGPQSAFVLRDLDFRVTQISDCVIVSAEISPSGLINLLFHCWGAAIQLLYKGVLCRGFITRGSVYHTDSQVIGSGYQNAYENERAVSAFAHGPEDRGTPFVEVDPVVCEYVNAHGDQCVREMFSRMVRTEGGVTALFPFQSIGHSFIIDARFDARREFAANQKVREGIAMLKERVLAMVDKSNQNAMRKVGHYIRALDGQLEICERTDEVIRKLGERG